MLHRRDRRRRPSSRSSRCSQAHARQPASGSSSRRADRLRSGPLGGTSRRAPARSCARSRTPRRSSWSTTVLGATVSAARRHAHGREPTRARRIELLFASACSRSARLRRVTLVFMSASIPADFAYATTRARPRNRQRPHGLGGRDDRRLGHGVAHRIPSRRCDCALLAASAPGPREVHRRRSGPMFPFMVAWSRPAGWHGVKDTRFRTLIHLRVAPDRARPSVRGLQRTRNAPSSPRSRGSAPSTTLRRAGTLWIAGGVAAASRGLPGGAAVAAQQRARLELRPCASGRTRGRRG